MTTAARKSVTPKLPRNNQVKPLRAADAAFALIVVAVVLFYRKPDALLNPQFWAEDGTVFFQQNWDHGIGALFLPHAGYFNLILRLVAFVAGALPFEYQPAAYTYLSLAVVLCVIARLFSPRLRLRHRFLLAVAVALATHTPEILLCLVNLQWYTAVLLILLLVQDPATTRGQLFGDLTLLFLAGLTGPHIIYLTPLFLVRAGFFRHLKVVRLEAAAALLLSVIQILALREWQTVPAPPAPMEEWLRVLIWKPVVALLFGWQIGAQLTPVIATGLLVGLIAFLFWEFRQRREERFLFSMISGAGLLAWLSVIYRFSTTTNLFGGDGGGERYFFVPRLALIWLLVLCFDWEWRRSKVAAGLLVLVLCAAVADFQYAPYPDLQWKEQIARVRKGETDTLLVNPVGFGEIHLELKQP